MASEALELDEPAAPDLLVSPDFDAGAAEQAHKKIMAITAAMLMSHNNASRAECDSCADAAQTAGDSCEASAVAVAVRAVLLLLFTFIANPFDKSLYRLDAWLIHA